MAGKVIRSVTETAVQQEGYLSTQDLKRAGVSRQALHAMVSRGDLVKVDENLYQLAYFPAGATVRLRRALARVAACAPALSHLDALELYGAPVGEIPADAPVGVTVPTDATVPPAVLRSGVVAVHAAPLHDDDRATYRGLPVTTYERAIRDVAAAGLLDQRTLGHAILHGRMQGHLKAVPATQMAQELCGKPLVSLTDHYI